MNKLLAEELSKIKFQDTFTLKNYEKLAKTRIKYISKDIQILRSLLYKDQNTEEFTQDMSTLKKQRTDCNRYLNIIVSLLSGKHNTEFDPKREFQLLLSSPPVDMTKYNGKPHKR